MQQQREIEGNETGPELLVLGGRRHQRPATALVVTSNDPNRLRAFLTRERQRKAITNVTEIVEVRPGVWAAKVTQLRPIRPAWLRPALVSGAVVGGLAGVGAAGWALVSLVAGAAAAVPGATVVGAVALAVLAWRLVSRGSRAGHGPECRVDVTVTHRH